MSLHLCACMCVHVHFCVCICMNACICVHVYPCMHLCVCIYVCICVCGVYVCVYYVFVWGAGVYLHVLMHIHTQSWLLFLPHLLFEVGSFIGPELHHIDQASCPQTSGDSPVSVSHLTNTPISQQERAATPSSLCRCWESEPRSSHYLTETFPQHLLQIFAWRRCPQLLNCPGTKGPWLLTLEFCNVWDWLKVYW